MTADFPFAVTIFLMSVEVFWLHSIRVRGKTIISSRVSSVVGSVGSLGFSFFAVYLSVQFQILSWLVWGLVVLTLVSSSYIIAVTKGAYVATDTPQVLEAALLEFAGRRFPEAERCKIHIRSCSIMGLMAVEADHEKIQALIDGVPELRSMKDARRWRRYLLLSELLCLASVGGIIVLRLFLVP